MTATISADRQAILTREIPFCADVPIERAHVEAPPVKTKECEGTDECTCRKCKWVVEGYATLAGLDEHFKYVTPEALMRARDDLLSYTTLLFNHDRTRPIGRLADVQYRNEPKALWIKAHISKNRLDVWRDIQDGVLSKFSIKGNIIDPVRVWDRDLNREIVRADKLKLYEVSIVSIPAQPEAKCLAWYIERALTDFMVQSASGGKGSKVQACSERSESDEGGEKMSETLKREAEVAAPPAEVLSKLEEVKDAFKEGTKAVLEGMSNFMERVDALIGRIEAEDVTPEDLRDVADKLEKNSEELRKDLDESEFETLSRDFSPEGLRKMADELEAAGELKPVLFADGKGNLYDAEGNEWEVMEGGKDEPLEQSLKKFGDTIVERTKQEVGKLIGSRMGIIRGLGSPGEVRPQTAEETKGEDFDRLPPVEKLKRALNRVR
jgi:HK97 family phage prohead protease